MRIYLAGKIRKNDWRHEIVPYLRGEPWDGDYYQGVREMNRPDARWPVLQKAIFGEHDYVGPFFLSCDHGCGHGPNQHGVAANCDDYDEEAYARMRYEADSYGGGCISTSAGSIRGEYVVNICNRAIEICDLFFAWINTKDCYGTLVELGYAKALKKKVWIAGPKQFGDMWFAYRSADKTNFDRDEAIDALREMLGERVDYYTYIKSDEWRAKAEDAKTRAGHRCQICNRSRSDVTLDAHHRTYERLGRELPTDITVLCRDCHELYEKNKRQMTVTTKGPFDFLWKNPQ